MKWIMTFILIMILGVGFTSIFLHDPGFIIIGWEAWTLETSLAFFVITLLLLLGGLWLLMTLLWKIWQLPQKIYLKKAMNQQYKSHENLIYGYLQLGQGQWASAEKTLTQINYSVLPGLHYLGAAYSAFQRGATIQGADYIDQAREFLPQDHPAIDLLQAQLQWQRFNLVSALYHARQAQQKAPEDAYIALNLISLYFELMDWVTLSTFIVELQEKKVLPAEELTRLKKAIENYTNATLE